MNSRRFDKFFSRSTGFQLTAIIGISIFIILLFFLFSTFNIQEIISLFIDPGAIDINSQWLPQLILVLIGFLLFSVLLSSTITAWITNLQSNIREGKRRYSLSNHIVIFGGGKRLERILSSIHSECRDILVISPSRPALLNDGIIYYKGNRFDKHVIADAKIEKASAIYIIGEDNEPEHDSRNLMCLDYIKEITKEVIGDPIHCFIFFIDEETIEVFQYQRGDDGNLSSKFLLVDAINEYSYSTEQLIKQDGFLPILTKDSTAMANFILLGTGKVAQALSYAISHACHYPRIGDSLRKTYISIISPDVMEFRDRLLLSRPYLFKASTYQSFYRSGETEVHHPEPDSLDIEWRFIEGDVADKNIQSFLKRWIDDPNLENRIVVCAPCSSCSVSTALHLPPFVYGNTQVSLYLEDSAEIIRKANSTKMYGDIRIFGPVADSYSCEMLERRSECGQRVNYIYELKYPSMGKTVSSPVSAWFYRSEADKLSSIYSAIGLQFRENVFDYESDDLFDVYDAEHRRWMMSEYLLGYRYGLKSDKLHFVHSSLVPFEHLPEEEKYKDEIIIKNRKYILLGEPEPDVR